MKRKTSRGVVGYVALLATLLMIAILLNGGLTQTVSKRIEYHELLNKIESGDVARVAIRNSSLVGLWKNTTVATADFPERSYDFETTIGADFLETVRQMEAKRQSEKTQQAVTAEQISVWDLPFQVDYRAPVTVPWWYDFLPYLIMLVIMGVVWYIMIRAQGGGNGRVMNFGRSRARVQDPAKNKITFADVAGADEEKEELQEMVDFLKNPRNYTELGARIPRSEEHTV